MSQENHSDKAVLITEAQSVINSIGTFKVTTLEEYAQRADSLKQVKAAIARLEKQRSEKLAPFRAGIAGINEMFKEPIERLENFEAQMKTAMVAFNTEQINKQREAQRKLDEQARKEREAAIAKATEVERKTQERVDELNRKAEEARKKGDHGAASSFLDKADRASYSGMVKALDLKEKATTTVAPVIAVQQPKVAGIATKQTAQFRIIDPTKINMAFMVPDEMKIRKQVNALKLDAKPIIGEGIEIWMEDSIAASRKG